MENKGDPEKAKKEQGELILGKTGSSPKLGQRKPKGQKLDSLWATELGLRKIGFEELHGGKEGKTLRGPGREHLRLLFADGHYLNVCMKSEETI